MKLQTPGATKLAGALLLVIVAALGWLLVLGPKTSTLSAVHAAEVEAQEHNESLALQLLTLQRQARDIDQTRAAARSLAAMFPPTADQPGLFRAVTEAASRAGIGSRDVTAVTPTPPMIGTTDPSGGVQLQTPSSTLARQTVTVTVQGTYAQTERLLSNIEAMSRAYLVTALTLASGSEGAAAFTTTVTGEMFVMAPAVNPDLETTGRSE